MSKNKQIYFIGGGKGGVGKSTVSIGLVDYLVARDEKVLLIETDTSNPDVWKMCGEEVESKLIDLDDANGWIDLVNICDEMKDHSVVVNTAARNNKGVAAYGQTLASTLEELQRDLVTFWVINRQRDSLELLAEYLDHLPNSSLHVLRNSYFGAEAKFELYNNSNVRKSVEARRGKSVTYPDLADRVSDDLYSNRLSIARAMQQLPIGNRAELNRWRIEVHKVLGELLHE